MILPVYGVVGHAQGVRRPTKALQWFWECSGHSPGGNKLKLRFISQNKYCVTFPVLPLEGRAPSASTGLRKGPEVPTFISVQMSPYTTVLKHQMSFILQKPSEPNHKLLAKAYVNAKMPRATLVPLLPVLKALTMPWAIPCPIPTAKAIRWCHCQKQYLFHSHCLCPKNSILLASNVNTNTYLILPDPIYIQHWQLTPPKMS